MIIRNSEIELTPPSYQFVGWVPCLSGALDFEKHECNSPSIGEDAHKTFTLSKVIDEDTRDLGWSGRSRMTVFAETFLTKNTVNSHCRGTVAFNEVVAIDSEQLGVQVAGEACSDDALHIVQFYILDNGLTFLTVKNTVIRHNSTDCDVTQRHIEKRLCGYAFDYLCESFDDLSGFSGSDGLIKIESLCVTPDKKEIFQQYEYEDIGAELTTSEFWSLKLLSQLKNELFSRNFFKSDGRALYSDLLNLMAYTQSLALSLFDSGLMREPIYQKESTELERLKQQITTEIALYAEEPSKGARPLKILEICLYCISAVCALSAFLIYGFS